MAIDLHFPGMSSRGFGFEGDVSTAVEASDSYHIEPLAPAPEIDGMAQFSRYSMFGVIPWLCLAPFQYGYAISQLNQVQQALTCKQTGVGDYGFPICIPMDDTGFGMVSI